MFFYHFTLVFLTEEKISLFAEISLRSKTGLFFVRVESWSYLPVQSYCRLVDLGEERDVRRGKLHVLDPQFSAFPAQSVKVKIKGTLLSQLIDSRTLACWENKLNSAGFNGAGLSLRAEHLSLGSLYQLADSSTGLGLARHVLEEKNSRPSPLTAFAKSPTKALDRLE